MNIDTTGSALKLIIEDEYICRIGNWMFGSNYGLIEPWRYTVQGSDTTMLSKEILLGKKIGYPDCFENVTKKASK